MHNVTNEIESYIKRNEGKKVIFAGLSMGALFAIEIASRLDIDIDAILVAGRTPVREEEEKESDSAVSKYAMVDSDSEAWTTHFLPLLKIDLSTDRRMYERVMMTKTRKRVGNLFLAFCGDEDDAFEWTDLPKWRSYCTDPKLFHGFMLRGKHSFLVDQADEMRDMLLTVMKRHANRLSLERREVRESCRAIQWTELSLNSTNEKQVKEYRLCADGTGLPSQVTESQIKIHVENGTNQGQLVKFLEFAQNVIRDSSSQSRLDVTLLCRTQYSESTAMIVGLSKCLELEFPDRIRVRRVYYSDEKDLKTSLNLPEHEHDIRIEKGKTYGLRVISNSVFSSIESQQLNREGRYIVTGGTGGIGRVLVKWMIERQHVSPENIILLTRKQVEESLDRRGVRLVTLDISKSSTSEMRDMLKDISNVHGIFHLAGALDDGIVLNMNKSRLENVIAPKRGGMNLLSVAKELKWNTKLFVSFSSTSSLFGYPGQSSYAAANSIFDHRVMFENENGVRFVCLNWGPWGEVGMARRGTKAYEMSRRSSEIPMKTQTCLRCLEAALSSKNQNWWMIAQVQDWSKTRWGSRSGIVEKLVLDKENDCDDDAVEKKTSSTTSVEIWLRERVSAWRPNDTLSELGIDSLDEVQMRTDFQNYFHVKVKMEIFVGAGRTLKELRELLENIVGGGSK